jgi:hypothetical protein
MADRGTTCGRICSMNKASGRFGFRALVARHATFDTSTSCRHSRAPKKTGVEKSGNPAAKILNAGGSLRENWMPACAGMTLLFLRVALLEQVWNHRPAQRRIIRKLLVIPAVVLQRAWHQVGERP